jgi:hypothetical protein
MTRVALEVAEFPGQLAFVAESTPAKARNLIRATRVPEEWIASRSYRDAYALLAAAPVRVGVDIERIDESVTPDAVLTPLEARQWGGPADWCSWWSAKEALAKALGDAKNYEPQRLESPALWPNARTGRWRTQQLPAPPGYVAWIIWEKLNDAPPRS